MAAPAVVRSSGPALCPSFAEVCSFLERYGATLDLPEMTFSQMERYLRDTTAVPKPLVELHVKLLRKLGKSVTTDRWERYLAKVCQELNSTWAWELEQKGYQDLSMECKSSILKFLCECQFDDNLKFKMAINEEEPEKMRLQPIGRDQQGLMYWLQFDHEQNIRLYTEEQDDLDGSTWQCIVRNRNDLAEALDLLKAQISPGLNPEPDQNQAGSRSNSPTEKGAGDEVIGSTDPEPSKTTEEPAERETLEPIKEEKPLGPELKEEQMQSIEGKNTDAEVKEKRTDHKPPVFDNRVSTITTIVKSESRETDAPKNAVSVVMAPGTTVIKQEVNKEEEAGRAVVRSNQQAKIPLKKRELKLAESYQSSHLNNSSSSIIVCNPSVIQSKDSHRREGKLLNSVAPPCAPLMSQQQQSVVSASKQELTNGRASVLLPHKDGQNGVIGVIGQVGVIGHIGVIRSPSERHRAPGAEQQEPNGPSVDHWSTRGVEEEREVSRQSVLVRKGPVEGDTSALPPRVAKEAQTPGKLLMTSSKTDQAPKAVEREVDAVSISSLSQATEELKRQTTEDLCKKATEEPSEKRTESGPSSRHQKDDEVEEREGRREVSGTEEGSKDNSDQSKSTLGKMEAESGGTVPPLKVEQRDENDHLDHKGDGVNDELAAQVRVKDTGLRSEGKQGPLEEASSELQKEGIRLKIKIPPHRRNKLRKGGKEGEKEREQEAQEDGRQLRRSTRICRPSSKVAESQRKKPQKKQALPSRTREGEEEEEEEEDEEEDEEEQCSAPKKDIQAEVAGQIRKQRGKRRHRRPRWSNMRSKRRKLNEGREAEDGGRKREDEESEGGSDSEESCKSEEIPIEDACSHCGLPNHPELILLCDSCDSGYHTACLRPPLMLIPDGQWFCPPCQHKLLCEKLEEHLQNLDSALKKRDRAERRRERLVYVGISVENIIPEGDEEPEEKSTKKKDPKKSKNLGRRSTRTRKNISYRFDDFDDAIDEAIEEDITDLCAVGTERSKVITPILPEDRKESQRPIRSQAHAVRSRKKRRLNDLESDSTAAESEDEFQLSNSSDDEDFGATGVDDDEEEDAGSEVGSWDSATRPKRPVRAAPKQRPSKTQRRGRKRQRRRHSSEEEEEESEEEMDSDQYSDMSDSEAEKKRRGLRRGQRQQVNYRETSESSDNSKASAGEKPVAAGGRPRRERLSSDFSDVSRSSRDSADEEDYEDEDDQRRRVNRRRKEEKDQLRNRMKEKRRRYQEDDRERGSRLKRKLLEKEEDKRRRLKRTHREEEDMEKMGRGKRREILSQQRRRRLAQMLKKRRPSTDDDDEEESEESDSSSEEDRPVRKRLNRIDSDEDDDDEEKEEEEEEDGRQKVTTKKSSSAERRSDSEAQEKGRGHSLSPSNINRISRGPVKPGAGSPTEPRDREASGRQGKLNGPFHPDQEEEEEEQEEEQEEEGGKTDSLNSVQNSPQS